MKNYLLHVLVTALHFNGLAHFEGLSVGMQDALNCKPVVETHMLIGEMHAELAGHCEGLTVESHTDPIPADPQVPVGDPCEVGMHERPASH